MTAEDTHEEKENASKKDLDKIEQDLEEIEKALKDILSGSKKDEDDEKTGNT